MYLYYVTFIRTLHLQYIIKTFLYVFYVLIDCLVRHARILDQLAIRNVAQGSPLGVGSTLHLLYSLHEHLQHV